MALGRNERAHTRTMNVGKWLFLILGLFLHFHLHGVSSHDILQGSGRSFPLAVSKHLIESMDRDGLSNITLVFQKTNSRTAYEHDNNQNNIFYRSAIHTSDEYDREDPVQMFEHLQELAELSWATFVHDASVLYGLEPNSFRYLIAADAICIDFVPVTAIEMIRWRSDVIEIAYNGRPSSENSESTTYFEGMTFGPPPSPSNSTRRLRKLKKSRDRFETSRSDSVESHDEFQFLKPKELFDINGDTLWDDGYFGQGIVVGISSTGISLEHEAIPANYRGLNSKDGSFDHNYNWYEAFKFSQSREPRDIYQIGTHITGTIAGNAADQFQGIAPKSKYIACKSINELREDTLEALLVCLDFFLAPFDLDGLNRKPELRVDVALTPTCESCDPSDSLAMVQAVDSLVEAGIMVVAPSGSVLEGISLCNRISRPPAIYENVLTVGALQRNGIDLPLNTSAAGPAIIFGQITELLKPNLVAVGQSVESSAFLSKDRESAYVRASGTPVSAAIVTGAVALLWSAAPELKNEVRHTIQLLERTANELLLDTLECSSTQRTPNMIFGHGKLDLRKALKKGKKGKGRKNNKRIKKNGSASS